MSTGLECYFMQVDGRWYYVLQQGSCPVLAWDWREYADCFGPFATFDEAYEHMGRNHANPGGYSKTENHTPDEVEQKMIAEAIAPTAWGMR